MYRCPSSINSSIPGEYRAIAESLFPPGGFQHGQGPNLKNAANFAESLGIGADYQRLLAMGKNNGELEAFLEHFQNNLDLLIQKTGLKKPTRPARKSSRTMYRPL